MMRTLLVLAAALALASCSAPLSKDDCLKAGEAGTWDVSFSLLSGDAAECPTLEKKTLELPDKCEANCGCIESAVNFVEGNSAVQNRCALHFQELCPDYALECHNVDVVSPSAAAGSCFLTVGTIHCGYSVSWTKLQ